MKTSAVVTLWMGVAFGAALGVEARDEVAPEPGGRLIRPVPAPGGVWKLMVQEKPHFPGEPQGEVSTPASHAGLSVTIQPERKEFGPYGPLAFRVVLENTSDRPLDLPDADWLGGKLKLVVSHRQTGAQWTLESPADGAAGKGKRLAAGETLAMTLVAQQNVVVRPIPPGRPIPLPRPIGPVPEFRKAAPARVGDAVPEDPAVEHPDQVKPGGGPNRRRPPAVFLGPPLRAGLVVPCGTGPCRAMLFIESRKPDEAAAGEEKAAGEKIAAVRTWKGKLAAKPVDFAIGAAGVVQPPVQIGPRTKEDAVRFAIPAAERALDATYQPVPNVRPAHSGTWIGDAEKTAEVTERKETGWTVRWTHTPKSGFSYNVTVDVDRNGGAVVREVFAGYRR